MKQRVAIVEFQRLFGAALAQLIASDERFTVVSASRSIVPDRLRADKPDLILIDLDMLAEDIPSLVGTCRGALPEARICFLHGTMAPETAETCVAAGADGFVVKDALPDDFLRALSTVAGGEIHVDGRVASALLQRRAGRRAPSALSPRETEVLRLIAQGSANKEIAAQLGLSVKTIKNQLSKIFVKLGIDSRTKAVVRAIDMGLV